MKKSELKRIVNEEYNKIVELYFANQNMLDIRATINSDNSVDVVIQSDTLDRDSKYHMPADQYKKFKDQVQRATKILIRDI